MNSTNGRTEMAVILFTDQVGSTEMLSAIGDLAADTVRREHDELVESCVTDADGRVVKWTGDGVLAAFESASSAVQAAVAIQRAVKAYNRRRQLQVPLVLRIGISAGDVTREEKDYFGIPVVEAKRLESAATPGGILVADVVRILAGSRAGVEIRSVGAVELKGLPGPVAAHEVIWDDGDEEVEECPLPESIVHADRFTLVGREAEMATLREAWARARAGELVVTVVGGEAGVGKTRLCHEFARRVHSEGALVLAGRQDDGLSLHFQPFMQALRFLVERVPGGAERLGRNPAALARLLPELAETLGGAADATEGVDPETEMYRLFDAVDGWLVDMSTDGPVLIVLDDIHWCPQMTLLLLRHLVRSHAVAPVMLLATFRNTEIDATPAFSDFIRAMRRERGVVRLDLDGLDSGAIAQLVDQASRGDESPEAITRLATMIAEQTAGNSYFASELVTALTTDAVAGSDNWAIPESVQDIVLARVDQLSPGAVELLEVAALAGAEFRLDVVAHAAGDTIADAGDTLREALGGRLLQEVEGSTVRFRFQHDLVRSTLELRLPGYRRTTLHRRLAAAYIELVGDDALDQTVSHLARSNGPADLTLLCELANRAGERASENLEYDRAAQIFGILLDAIRSRDVDRALVAETMVRLAVAQRRSRDPNARRTLLDAGRLARELGLDDLEVKAALTNSRGLVWIGDPSDPERSEQFEHALSICPSDQLGARARLLSNLGVEHRLEGRVEQHKALADEAIELARRSGDPKAFAPVLNARIMMLWRGDNAEERFRLACELRDMQPTDNSPEVVAVWTSPLVYAAIELGRLDDATAANDVLRAAALTGGASLRYNAALAGGVLAVARGRIAAARAHADDVVTQGRLCGQAVAPILAAGIRFNAAMAEGTAASFADELGAFAELVPRVRSFRFGQAYALACGGQTRAATETLAEWWDKGFSQLENDRDELTMLAYAAGVVWRARLVTAARALIEQLSPYRDVVGCNGTVVTGVMGGWIAPLYDLLGQHERAEAAFERCLDQERAMPFPTSTARVLVERATCRLDRAVPDVVGARADAEEALDIAERFGLIGTERAAAELLDRTVAHT